MTRRKPNSRHGATSVKKQQPTPKQQKNHEIIHQEVTQEFSGPIPPPKILEEYNKVAPDAADRIIAMAEQEACHRRSIEKSILSNEYNEARTGQKFALAIGVLAIVSASIISVLGTQWAGAIIGGGGVIGLVSVFIYGRRKHK